MEEELPDSPTRSDTIPNVNYFITSVYDHSVFDSMSRVIQRLLPCQFALERLLDVLCAVRLSKEPLISDQAHCQHAQRCRILPSTRPFCFICPQNSTLQLTLRRWIPTTTTSAATSSISWPILAASTRLNRRTRIRKGHPLICQPSSKTDRLTALLPQRVHTWL